MSLHPNARNVLRQKRNPFPRLDYPVHASNWIVVQSPT